MGKGISASMQPESGSTATLTISFGDGKSAVYPNVPIELAAAVVEEPRRYNSEIKGRQFGGSGFNGNTNAVGALDIADAILDLSELL
jgi:hypothetical protein